MTSSLPRLYSFRRCPYAMRARLGLLFAEQQVELREIVLKNKPEQMLAISPKGTVPVLELTNGTVLEESYDIMLWALTQHDPQDLLAPHQLAEAKALIEQNDNEFKSWLDRYKYADRHPEMSQVDYRQGGEVFLQKLEALLANRPFLLADKPTLADIAVMPFVRQFAHVDREVFYALPYPKVQQWLQYWLAEPVFLQVMTKLAPWQPTDEQVLFPAHS